VARNLARVQGARNGRCFSGRNRDPPGHLACAAHPPSFDGSRRFGRPSRVFRSSRFVDTGRLPCGRLRPSTRGNAQGSPLPGNFRQATATFSGDGPVIVGCGRFSGPLGGLPAVPSAAQDRWACTIISSISFVRFPARGARRGSRATLALAGPIGRSRPLPCSSMGQRPTRGPAAPSAIHAHRRAIERCADDRPVHDRAPGPCPSGGSVPAAAALAACLVGRSLGGPRRHQAAHENLLAAACGHPPPETPIPQPPGTAAVLSALRVRSRARWRAPSGPASGPSTRSGKIDAVGDLSPAPTSSQPPEPGA